MRSEYFTFDGRKSLDMGYYSVRVGEPDAEQELLGDKKPKTITYGTKLHNYINKIEYEPIEFKLQIIPIKEKQWTIEMFSTVCEWLIRDEYKPFISEDDPSKILYAISTGSTSWKGVMLYGVMEIDFITNAYHAWTYPRIESVSVQGSKTINIKNLKNVGDRLYSPAIEIEKTGGNGDITITNLSNNNKETKLTNINDKETFTMDNDYHIFKSDTPTNYYGEHFNKQWLYLIEGNNKLKIDGNCNLEFKLQFPIV